MCRWIDLWQKQFFFTEMLSVKSYDEASDAALLTGPPQIQIQNIVYEHTNPNPNPNTNIKHSSQIYKSSPGPACHLHQMQRYWQDHPRWRRSQAGIIDFLSSKQTNQPSDPSDPWLETGNIHGLSHTSSHFCLTMDRALKVLITLELNLQKVKDERPKNWPTRCFWSMQLNLWVGI